jgi:hypothetical protein
MLTVGLTMELSYLLGFRTSRFQIERISCPQDSWFPDSHHANGRPSFREISRVLWSLPRILLWWTVLITSHNFGTFATPMTEILCQLKTPITDVLTGLQFPPCVSSNGWSRSFLGLPHGNSRYHVIVTPDFTNVDIPMAMPLVEIFPSVISDGLNTVHLPVRSDGWRVSVWTSNSTQSPLLCTSPDALWTWKSSNGPDLFDWFNDCCDPSRACSLSSCTWKNPQVPKGLNLCLSSLRDPIAEFFPAFSMMLFLLSFSPGIPKGFFDFCASTKSSHAHTVLLSLLRFPIASPYKETRLSFPFSHKWRIFGCPPDYPLLKQPLAESTGCSAALWRSLSRLFLQNTKLKEFSSPVPVCTMTQIPTWQSVNNPQWFWLLKNSQQSSSSVHHCACAQCPLGRASQNSSNLLSVILFSSTALPPTCSVTLRSSLSCWFQFLCCSTSLSKPAEFKSATSVHGYQNSQCSVTPSWCEASKTFTWNQTHSCKCKPTV